jgi:hypothetical protein
MQRRNHNSKECQKYIFRAMKGLGWWREKIRMEAGLTEGSGWREGS